MQLNLVRQSLLGRANLDKVAAKVGLDTRRRDARSSATRC